MQGFIVLIGLIALWKICDTAVSMYQMHLSTLIESWRIEKANEGTPLEHREIGFDNYGDTRRQVDAEEYEG